MKHKQNFMSTQSHSSNIQHKPVCSYVKHNVITINNKYTDFWDITHVLW